MPQSKWHVETCLHIWFFHRRNIMNSRIISLLTNAATFSGWYAVPEEKRLIPASRQETKTLVFTEMEDASNKCPHIYRLRACPDPEPMVYRTIRQVTISRPISWSKMALRWLSGIAPLPVGIHQEAALGSDCGIERGCSKATPVQDLPMPQYHELRLLRIIGFHFQTNFLGPYNQTPFVRRGKDLQPIPWRICERLWRRHHHDQLLGRLFRLSKWFDG